MKNPLLPHPTLTTYATGYLDNVKLKDILPRFINAHEKVTTCVLHSTKDVNTDRYMQVELVIMHPGQNWNRQEHRHPNVDSYEIELFGCIGFTRNGVVVSEPDGIHANHNFVYLDHTDWHGIGDGYSLGSILLSVQMWALGVSPTSVGLDWEGLPVSEGHAIQLPKIPSDVSAH